MSKTKHKKDCGKYKSHFELEVAEKLGKDNYEISERKEQSGNTRQTMGNEAYLVSEYSEGPAEKTKVP